MWVLCLYISSWNKKKLYNDYQYIWSSGHDEGNHIGHFFCAQDFGPFHFSVWYFRCVEYLSVHETRADALIIIVVSKNKSWITFCVIIIVISIYIEEISKQVSKMYDTRLFFFLSSIMSLCVFSILYSLVRLKK